MVSWVAVQAGVGAALLIGDYIYHRLTDKQDKPTPVREMKLPHAEDGAPIAMIYGRCRVRTPILAWHGIPRSAVGSVGNGSQDVDRIYLMDMFLVLGLAMNDGNGDSDVHGMWAGDVQFDWLDTDATHALAEQPRSIDTATNLPVNIFHGGSVEIFDGDPAQELTDATGAAVTDIAGSMLTNSDPAVAGTDVPGYRGYISVGLFAGGGFWWSLGANASPPAYSFEASSYEDGDNYPAVGIYARIGYDLNPINALYDFLKGKHGKAGIDPTTYIDSASFAVAATTLYSESHGYSRCIDRSAPLDKHITELLEQIDAALYADEKDSKYKIKLIRNDYSIPDLPHITKDNCVDLINFSIGGWTGLTNKVRLVYSNRDRGYNDDSAVAHNTANAAGQDGLVNETVISMPGVTVTALAERLARRELAARSRPVMKCRAIVTREFIRVNPGDAVLCTWSDPDISRIVFRVAAVDRGTLENGKVALDLIQDYFYSYRSAPPQPPGLDHPDIGNGINVGFQI